jgi:hypothetical protein
MKLLNDAAPPRIFRLVRKTDISGVSGTGHVADGVTFYDGTTAIYWRTEFASMVVFQSLEHLLRIHGHDGATTIEWMDT